MLIVYIEWTARVDSTNHDEMLKSGIRFRKMSSGNKATLERAVKLTVSASTIDECTTDRTFAVEQDR